MASDNAILLDTCTLIPFFMDWEDDQRCTQATLKKLLLLGARPQVHESVIAELRRVLKRKWSANLDGDAVVTRIHDFVPPVAFEVVKVPNKVRRRLHYAKKEEDYTTSPIAGLSLVDRQLALHSMLESVPVFTYDKQILAAMGQPPVVISLPTPFDDAAISELSFEDIAAMSPMMRGLLRSSIEEIRKHIAQCNDAQEQQQQAIHLAEELDGRIQKLMSQKSELMDLVRPDLGKSALWTTIELALGFVPVPIPTTPATSLIQSRRLAALEKKWNESGGEQSPPAYPEGREDAPSESAEA